MSDGITRTWLILLVDACQKAGLTPIPKDRFHRIIYLSNCLAPLFQETPEAARLVKFRRGPFYPHVQWQLDHLGAVGVLDISELSYIRDEVGSWMLASYGPNQSTAAIIERLTMTAYGRRLAEYLTEVVFAFAALRGKFWDEVALHDTNYLGRGEDSMINLDRENLSMRTAEHFQTLLPAGIRPSQRQELFVYLRFLERLSEKGPIAV